MNILQFGKTSKEVAERISREVPRTVQLQMLFDTFPEGIRRGNDFMLGSLGGERGQSLRINIDINSPWFLNGKDFESGEQSWSHFCSFDNGIRRRTQKERLA